MKLIITLTIAAILAYRVSQPYRDQMREIRSIDEVTRALARLDQEEREELERERREEREEATRKENELIARFNRLLQGVEIKELA